MHSSQADQSQNEDLLVVRRLVKHYPVTRGAFRKVVGRVKAVDGVSLTVRRGETFGLVGESGCGKSTLARLLLRLEEPTSGLLLFDGVNLLDLKREKLQEIRRRMQIIFQDPYSSLNPRQTVGKTIAEGLVIHRIGTPSQRQEKVRHFMNLVGLHPDDIHRYPHEFSGGQRQRIGIARALALEPKLVICDEPVSALDVSIQAQVINLLIDLQEQLNLTYLFISHDLSVVRHVCDRVAVMYLGRLVEMAPKETLYDHPMHPYTQNLLEAAPVADPDARRPKRRIRGELPSPMEPPPGCRFHTRCASASERCQSQVPAFVEREPGHWVRCFLYGEDVSREWGKHGERSKSLF